MRFLHSQIKAELKRTLINQRVLRYATLTIMDKKFKRLAKACKIFPKNKKIFKNKSKNLEKTRGEKLRL